MSGFDFWEACRAAIAIDSTSTHGNREYVEFLKKLLAPMDFSVRTQEIHEGEYRGVNLIAEKGGGPDVILFDTHLDTVSPGNAALWTETGGDPFRATFKNGKIFGLGVADVKLDFLCKLKALEPFIGRRFRNRFILLGTFGEEVGLIGAKAFLDDYHGQLDFALIGEPTSLKLVNRHKGRACYEFRLPAAPAAPAGELVTLDVKGEAAHSSTPERGRNAIEAALEFLSALSDPPTGVCLEGGTLLNVVPESCAVTMPASERALAGVRPARDRPPLLDPAPLLSFWDAIRSIQRSLPKDTTWVCATVRTESDAYVFEFDSRFWEDSESVSDEMLTHLKPAACRILRKNASFYETSDAWHVEGLCGALSDIGLKAEFTAKTASTEAALFGQRCTSLVFGPGPSEGNVHRPNEYNLVSELETAIRAYESILRRLVAVPDVQG
ncbi:MAG: hypothetical protein A3G34_13285 [Candidatus Lindowbacteria bacterium RIFCSPLOWO2_12_FULL_62_27]|nr:MAG: hypothetical protein A3I06_04655 [Candidatus Lindowbacteria bacterium RIFCSPLOWO2_02_FULL_62_12]OGH62557.1 MAG: hypothetical protein A3G34_13285 [Candidatus Lindowbacteria bacterium RIFCSPLOWO2_12_FULL_62_27]